jgi:hypothetical protein
VSFNTPRRNRAKPGPHYSVHEAPNLSSGSSGAVTSETRPRPSQQPGTLCLARLFSYYVTPSWLLLSIILAFFHLSIENFFIEKLFSDALMLFLTQSEKDKEALYFCPGLCYNDVVVKDLIYSER